MHIYYFHWILWKTILGYTPKKIILIKDNGIVILQCRHSAVHTSRSLKLQLISKTKKQKKNTARQSWYRKISSLGIKPVWPLNQWRALDKKEKGKGTSMNWKNKRNLAKQIQTRKKGTDPGQCENWCVIVDGHCVLQNDGSCHGLIRYRTELFSPNGHLTQGLNETLEVLMIRLKKLKSNF